MSDEVSQHQDNIDLADQRRSLITRKGSMIIELMKGGMTYARAAEVAEVSRSTIANWLKRGLTEQRRIEAGEEPDPAEAVYMDFALGVTKAESEAQAGLVLAWFKEARSGDWKAAERFLAKRWPQEWGDNNTVKLEVGGVGQFSGEVSAAPTVEEDTEKKRAVLAALVEAGDLPDTVLAAWDKDEVIDAEVIEESE